MGRPVTNDSSVLYKQLSTGLSVPKYYQIAWKQVSVLPFRGKKKKDHEVEFGKESWKMFQ